MLANSWNLGGKLACLGIVLVPLALAQAAEAKPVLTLLPKNTTPIAINDSGVVVGQEEAGMAFVRTPDGRMTRFKAESLAAATYSITVPTAINSSGVVTGQFWDYKKLVHGFVRAADGTVTVFDVPNAGHASGFETFPYSVSTEGVITGYYKGYNGLAHGFVRAVDGTFTSFDVPKAVQTYAMAANDKGEATGYWLGYTCYCGFVRSARGEITTFDVQDSTVTRPVAIDSNGTVTGYYDDQMNTVHGFVRQRDGEITTFDAPSVALAIADGAVTGYSHYVNTGFVRHKNGRVRAISANSRVFPLGINTHGVVVGYLANQYGFIWTP